MKVKRASERVTEIYKRACFHQLLFILRQYEDIDIRREILHPKLKGDFRALRSKGVVYFPGAVCADVFLRATRPARISDAISSNRERMSGLHVGYPRYYL